MIKLSKNHSGLQFFAGAIGYPIHITLNGAAESFYCVAASWLDNSKDISPDYPLPYTCTINKVIWSDNAILVYNGTDVLPSDNIIDDGTYTTRADTKVLKQGNKILQSKIGKLLIK